MTQPDQRPMKIQQLLSQKREFEKFKDIELLTLFEAIKFLNYLIKANKALKYFSKQPCVIFRLILDLEANLQKKRKL